MTTARGFLGAGDIYIQRYDPTTGLYLEPVGPYESTKFEIKATTKLIEMTGRGKDTYGQVLESVALPQPTEFTMALAEVNKESLTLALLGTQASLTQTAGSVVDEAMTATLGSWFKLAKNSLIAGSVVITNSAASTTYVEGTDYKVNYQLGWVQPIVGGAITNAQALKVDYGYGLVSGVKIKGVTAAQLRAQILFDGINMADNAPAIVECWEAVISSSAAFDFMADKFNEIPLTGRLKTPVGKTEPFEVRLPRG